MSLKVRVRYIRVNRANNRRQRRVVHAVVLRPMVERRELPGFNTENGLRYTHGFRRNKDVCL